MKAFFSLIQWSSLIMFLCTANDEARDCKKEAKIQFSSDTNKLYEKTPRRRGDAYLAWPDGRALE